MNLPANDPASGPQSAAHAPSRAELAASLSSAPCQDLSSLPGTNGPPLVGHTLQFVLRTHDFVREMTARHGSVFRARVFGHPVLHVGDPDGVKTVLMDRDRNFSNRLGWQHAIGELFANGLMLRDFEEHRSHRRIMQTAFRAEAMRGYLDLMNPLIESGVKGWRPAATNGEPLRFYLSIKKLTLDLAAEVFLGVPLGPQADRINQAFSDSVAASIALVKREVPFLAYRRGMEGRRFLEQFFFDLIDSRRAGDGADMFTQFCQATTEDGERYSDREIVDHMIFLLMAAHDTTTSSATSLVWALAQNQDWQEKLREEARSLPSGPLGYDDRDRLKVMELAFKEALRLYPPVPFMGRRALEPCEIAGMEVPGNSAVSVVSLITHFREDIWSAPREFDPERFSTQRAEEKQHTHAYFPFGGGAHTCIGMHFAILQVKAFLLEFLRRYRVRLLPGHQEVMRPIPIPHPKKGLPVILETL